MLYNYFYNKNGRTFSWIFFIHVYNRVFETSLMLITQETVMVNKLHKKQWWSTNYTRNSDGQQITQETVMDNKTNYYFNHTNWIYNGRQSWLCLYGSWIYNYLCIQCLSPLTWVWILLMVRCTRYNDITEILLKVALNTITLTPTIVWIENFKNVVSPNWKWRLRHSFKVSCKDFCKIVLWFNYITRSVKEF